MEASSLREQEGAKQRRGSGISLPLNAAGMPRAMRPSNGADQMQGYHGWGGGYNFQQPYPILINPPPMPTVR